MERVYVAAADKRGISFKNSQYEGFDTSIYKTVKLQQQKQISSFDRERLRYFCNGIDKNIDVRIFDLDEFYYVCTDLDFFMKHQKELAERYDRAVDLFGDVEKDIYYSEVKNFVVRHGVEIDVDDLAWYEFLSNKEYIIPLSVKKKGFSGEQKYVEGSGELEVGRHNAVAA